MIYLVVIILVTVAFFLGHFLATIHEREESFRAGQEYERREKNYNERDPEDKS